jgi:DNA-binding MarR family transcriptional regulator
VNDDDVSRLFDLADLILAVGRQIRPSHDLGAEMCTPLESAVMRFIDRNPGASAGEASAATLLPSSNFSRALRGLEAKGLVRRGVDGRDARCVRLYPTEQAQENLRRLREGWSQALDGIVDDPGAIDAVNITLRRIEAELVSRRRRGTAGSR